ncbi:HAD family hydrolase [Pedosphaera parvula]|uniref:HAD-superfamily hydrolase, subfamily IA, variant 3 n=1 Tax=Pedosphaera parvula (strain Ellin514) TaxID=320771 RepID=B9XNI7_PEDPL|nr:HAD family phosphatase [Pedosphaera parvula]EEF58646.1 HAD-superfamily hydrolase, subfamily IA, variant 3 [Pedosphaera parvula Ellin514]
MNLPEVVVFDLGKVLVDFDYGIVARKLAARGTISAAEVQKFIDHSPLLFRYETGLMTKQEFFQSVSKETGFCGDLEEFSRIFADIFEPIPRMIELHRSLRTKGIPTFIFSNTNEIAVAHIRKSYPFFANFDGYILSYQHGVMKPQAGLYEVVERETKRRNSEILYLDDRAENVTAGAARGWQVVLQESPEKTWDALRTIGLVN